MGNHRTDLGKDSIESGMTLITDPRSDRYLNNLKKKRNDPPEDRLKRHCGGKNGFDDYVERME